MSLPEPPPLPEPERGGQTIVDERTETYRYDDGDADRFSHYVKKEKIVESAVTGQPVRALCGKEWVPSRDPQRFPVCPECKKIYDGLPAGKPGDGDQN